MNPKCLHCHTALKQEFRWTDFLTFSFFRTDPLLPLAEWLCPACLEELEWLADNLCPSCSRSFKHFDPTYIKEFASTVSEDPKRNIKWTTPTQDNAIKICYDCYRWKQWEQEQGVDQIMERNISAITYNTFTQQWIEEYKFRRDLRLKYFLASILMEKVNRLTPSFEASAFDLIIPIPLSPLRLRERGFNQSEEIAELIAQIMQIEMQSDVLWKRDEDQKQSKKNRHERLEEMLKKFLKNPHSQVDIYNKRIILIDDIYTTGATLYAAASVLKREGVASVTSLTIAR